MLADSEVLDAFDRLVVVTLWQAILQLATFLLATLLLYRVLA